MDRAKLVSRFSAAFLSIIFLFAAAAWAHSSETSPKSIVQGLADPRGIAVDDGRLLVVQTRTGEITEVTKGKNGAVTRAFATVPGANDVAAGDHGKAYAVASLPPETGDLLLGKLYKIDRDGDAKEIADIGEYQKTDPDPDDQEENPADTNPNGLAYLGHHGILVVDAAGNDLLRIRKDGSIETVARFPTKILQSPGGEELPPAGTPIPAEAVPTSVTVGPDGAWYVSELTGFPFTKGASRIWRIKPGTEDVTCDPEAKRGPCTLFADGFTSVIDTAWAGDKLLVLEIVKEGLLAAEEGGAEPIGALWVVKRDGSKKEIAPGTLLAPGGVAVGHGALYVTTGTISAEPEPGQPAPPAAGEVVKIDSSKLGDGGDRPHGGNGGSGSHGHHGHGHHRGHGKKSRGHHRKRHESRGHHRNSHHKKSSRHNRKH